MEIRCLGDSIGAEITGVDVKTIGDSEFQEIYRAWLDFNVVVVRDQTLSILDYLAYSRRFGFLVPHTSKITQHPEFPEITMLGANKIGVDGKLNMSIYRRGAAGFHTDGNFAQEPYKATQLYALAIPSRGGDTHFSSMYTAYDRLPADLKTRLEGVYGIYLYGGRKAEGSALHTEVDKKKRVPARHLLLGSHRETGKKVLYFDPIKISCIEGLDQAASNELIDTLTGYMTPEGTQYTHKWRKGDIVIWDNRCSFHKAAGDYPPEEDRIHWRVSIKEASATH
jgi:taurine dioxygenase